jgi:hypothetical protein
MFFTDDVQDDCERMESARRGNQHATNGRDRLQDRQD